MVDPFAGLSTALVQASFEGIPSVGFESHPFFYDMSVAKLSPPLNTAAIDALEEMLLAVDNTYSSFETIWSEDALKFLRKLVPETQLELLAAARETEQDVPGDLIPIFRLILSRTLEYCTTSQTDGIYKAPTTRKNSTPYREAVSRVVDQIRQDINLILGEKVRQVTLAEASTRSQPEESLYGELAEIHHQPAQDMSDLPDSCCTLCVTSPPYLNNFDFAEMTRMELYYWGYAGSWGEITEKIRRELIVNTTTAPLDLRKSRERFRSEIPGELVPRFDDLTDNLKLEKENRGGSKDYYRLVYPYFGQMYQVFRELSRVLEPKAPLHMIVADSALYGVHIDTEKYLAELLEHAGFQLDTISDLRKRGDRWELDKRTGSSKGLGEYHIQASSL